MPRLKLTLAYLGQGFAGWQLQPGERTVQGCLEDALAVICQVPVRAHASGRTDAGVHALGQVAHVDVPDGRRDVRWRRALNSLLPEDVRVVRAETAPPDFHARYRAKAKTYAYTLWLERAYVLPQRAPFVWQTGPLDLDALDQAARQLTGEHDFAAFQNTGTPVKDTVRNLMAVTRRPGLHPLETVIRFTATGFLKQMCRNLAGLLVQAGQGKVSPQTVRSLFSEDRQKAGYPTAPARGLCLERVWYGATPDGEDLLEPSTWPEP